MSRSTSTSSGLGFTGTVLVIFVILKLTDNITWSWLWVLSPLWLPIVLVGAIWFALAPFRIVAAIRDARRRRNKMDRILRGEETP